MKFLRNCWYVAAWSSELEDVPIEQTIIGDKVVLYRGEGGKVAAVGGTCPHRFAPLWKGKVVGDLIECPYHGLRFDRNGACVLNQFEPDSPPPNASVVSYAVVERDRLIYIWMGNPAVAKISEVPNFPELLDEGNFTVGLDNKLHQDNGYELILDNLMDLSHVQFVHANTLASDSFDRDEYTMKPFDRGVRVSRQNSDIKVPGFLLAATLFKPQDRVDTWSEAVWTAPGVYELETGGKPVGARREDGAVLKTLHLLTPQDEKSTTYRYIMYRTFARDNELASSQLENVIGRAFTDEDEPMIHDVQDRMGGKDFWELRPVILPTDKAAIMMRRTLRNMIRYEEAETP